MYLVKKGTFNFLKKLNFNNVKNKSVFCHCQNTNLFFAIAKILNCKVNSSKVIALESAGATHDVMINFLRGPRG